MNRLFLTLFCVSVFFLLNMPPASAAAKVTAPSNLLAVPISNTQISLSWADNSADETGFIVEGSLDGNFFYQVAATIENTTSFLNAGLSPGTIYYYRVRAIRNEGGTISYSKNTAITSAVTAGQTLSKPLNPTGLGVAVVSYDSLNVSWTDTSNNENGFLLERSLDGKIFSQVATTSQNVVAYSDTGLDPRTTYYYRIRAYRADGEYIVYSDYFGPENARTLNSPLSKPTRLTATAISYSGINLSWQDDSNNENGFSIERSVDGVNFSEIARTSANTSAYSDTALVASTKYYYRVRAFKNDVSPAEYSVYARDVNAETFIFPLNAPSGLSATAISYSQINLAWTDNSSNESGFYLERSINGVDFSQIAQISESVTSYQDTDLMPGTMYYYRLRAYSVVGGVFYFSTFSGLANISTAASPLATPNSLTATALSSSQINLTWSESSVNEDGFLVERSIDGANFSQVAVLPANTTAYSDAGLDSGTRYYYLVAAYRNAGAEVLRSNYSNRANATTNLLVIAAPSLLVATATSHSQINVSWQDNSNNETGFLVERSLNGVNFFTAGTVGAGITSFQDSNLVSNTTYYYRVRAVRAETNKNVYSSYSLSASAETDSWLGIIGPSELTVSFISYYEITLAWLDNSSNENGFDIYRSTDGINFIKIAEVDSNQTSFVSTGLNDETNYYFRVRAKNINGAEVFYSSFSNTASGTTLSAPYIARPTNINCFTQPWYQIDVSWQDNANNETGYWVEKSLDDNTFFPFSYVGMNGNMISDSDISPGETYYYRTRAIMVVDDMTFYSEYSSTTVGTNFDAPPTTAPSNLRVLSLSAGRAVLVWNDTTNNEVGFFLERSDNGGEFYPLAVISPNNPSYIDESLEAGVNYVYRVNMAVDSYGYYFYSGYSNTVEVIGL